MLIPVNGNTDLPEAWKTTANTDELSPMVYDELPSLAASQMAQEGAAHALQATALVNEAYMRLLGGSWQACTTRGPTVLRSHEPALRLHHSRATNRRRKLFSTSRCTASENTNKPSFIFTQPIP